MELVLNDFEAGRSITLAIGRGWALEIEAILGPEMTTSEVSISSANPIALVIDMPASKSLRSTVPYKQQVPYISSYYTWVCGVQMVAWLRA